MAQELVVHTASSITATITTRPPVCKTQKSQIITLVLSAVTCTVDPETATASSGMGGNMLYVRMQLQEMLNRLAYTVELGSRLLAHKRGEET